MAAKMLRRLRTWTRTSSMCFPTITSSTCTSTCGANLNEGPCGCAPGDDADFEMAKNPFAALAGFEFSDEDGKDASDR